MTSPPRSRRAPSAERRASFALLAGLIAGVCVCPFMLAVAAILVGWDVAATIFLAWTWIAIWNLDSATTAHYAKREDPNRPVAELAITGAGCAALVAVG